MANSETEFNSLQFEKKLTNLKDSQESINKCCHWCLENRQHHKKIVTSWLNVLKRVKVEHRLTLFYLANDVIQYSKRRNYDFVESWGTSLQKATTMVRDEKIKHKILRIFKIWEQRIVYSEEFIADLCGLISVSPVARKNDEPHEFQSSYLITKIRNCAKLETDTDCKLKKLKEANPKKLDGESLCASLKHRAHVDDVEKEVDDYIKCIDSYINALKLEIKARNHLISLLTQAETQLSTDKKDVKLVANAYKTFATRVKHLKKKLQELKPTLTSPIPSPDINAPSPSPDSDIELPVTDALSTNTTNYTTHFTNPGFYTPVTNTDGGAPFANNGFSSFIGSSIPFDLESINSSVFGNNQSSNKTATYNYNENNQSLFTNQTEPPPPPAQGINNDYQYTSQVPLLPPPLPPFTKSENFESGYNDSYNSSNDISYGNTSYDSVTNPYEPSNTSYQIPATTYQSNDLSTFQPSSTYPLPVPVPDYQSAGTSYNSNYTPTKDYNNSQQYQSNDEYNPEEELEAWEPESNWDQPPTELETPESPPIFEKKSYNAPVEYHDNQTHGTGVDVDHRVLPIIPTQKIPTESDHGHRKKDVDHRNLISLTESPKDSSPKSWHNKMDQDYRQVTITNPADLEDKDYRIPFNMENLNLPPPPPPPSQTTNKNLANKKSRSHSPKKSQDNVESIDMELSDDDNLDSGKIDESSINENLTVVPIEEKELEPPPPFPDLPDEIDTNIIMEKMNHKIDNKDWNNSHDELMPHLPTHSQEQVWNTVPEIYPPWMDNYPKEPNYLEEVNYNRKEHRGNNRINYNNNRSPMEFRGRGRANNWLYRSGGSFRGSPRGSPRPYGRGMPRGNRNFPRGNFRGGY